MPSAWELRHLRRTRNLVRNPAPEVPSPPPADAGAQLALLRDSLTYAARQVCATCGGGHQGKTHGEAAQGVIPNDPDAWAHPRIPGSRSGLPHRPCPAGWIHQMLRDLPTPTWPDSKAVAVLAELAGDALAYPGEMALEHEGVRVLVALAETLGGHVVYPNQRYNPDAIGHMAQRSTNGGADGG